MDSRLAGGEGCGVTKVSQSAESRHCDGNGDIFYPDLKIPQQHGKSPEDLRHRIPIVSSSSESHDDKSSVDSPGSSPNSASYGTNTGEGKAVNQAFDVSGPSLISSSANCQAMVVDRVALEGDLCVAATSLAAEDTNMLSSTLGQGVSNTKSRDRDLYPSQVTSTKVSRTGHTSKDVEEHTFEKQLRAFVSKKLAATGNLDQAGMCALQALSKMKSSTRSSSPTQHTAPTGGTSSSKVRAPPPGLEDVRKFNGEDPSSLTRVLKHYSGCVRAALRRPGITSEQVNRALVRDVGFVLEGSPLEFYNLMMDGKVDWHPVAPPLAASAPPGAYDFGIGEKSRIPTKWREVCDAMHDKFLPGESISRTSLSLLSLRQSSDETIAQYAERQVSINQRLSWLVERHGGITVWEALQIGLFERGLPAELLRAQHAEPACMTFQECVDRAARNEVILSSRSVVEGVIPEESTNVPARDVAQEMHPLKPQMHATSSHDDATGQCALRMKNDVVPLHGHDESKRPAGPAGHTSTEKTKGGKTVVKTELLLEGEAGQQAQQETGADKLAVDPPGTRAKNKSDDGESERPKDPRQQKQQRSLSKTGAVQDDSTISRTACSTESSSEKANPKKCQLAAKQGDETDATASVDRKRRRSEEDACSRVRSPRRPNKSCTSDHEYPCKIPGCNQPTSHATHQCFHHPEFGLDNKARFRERRRSLAQRRHQRQMGELMMNNLCNMSQGYEESFL